jgi:hypothetical protein
MMEQPTRPSRETRDAERDEADAPHQADRAATPDEERLAEEHQADPDVAQHEAEMAERGVEDQGEGRIP